MSRSYKKSPWSGDKKGKNKKRIANQAIRSILKRDLELNVQNGSYKKLYESWNICDFGGLCSWKEYWEAEIKTYLSISSKYPNLEYEFPDKEKSYQKWKKYCVNK